MFLPVFLRALTISSSAFAEVAYYLPLRQVSLFRAQSIRGQLRLPTVLPSIFAVPFGSGSGFTVISHFFADISARRGRFLPDTFCYFSTSLEVGDSRHESGLARARLCMSPCSSDHIMFFRQKVERIWRVVVEDLLEHKHKSFSLPRLS